MTHTNGKKSLLAKQARQNENLQHAKYASVSIHIPKELSSVNNVTEDRTKEMLIFTKAAKSLKFDWNVLAETLGKISKLMLVMDTRMTIMITILLKLSLKFRQFVTTSLWMSHANILTNS